MTRQDGLHDRGLGLFIYELDGAGQPLSKAFSGILSAAPGWGESSIAASEDRIYHGGNIAPLLITEFDAQGQAHLLGYEDLSEEEAAARLAIDDFAALGIRRVLEFAAIGDRLFTLDGEHETPRLSRIDATKPLALQLESQLDLEGLDLYRAIHRSQELDLYGDLGHSMTATADGRLFLAASDSAMLVEIQALEGDMHELARYPEVGKARCALSVEELLYTINGPGDPMIISKVSPKIAPEIISTLDLPNTSTSCALARHEDQLLVAVDGGVQLFDITSPAQPVPEVFVANQGQVEIVEMLFDGELAVLALGGQWSCPDRHDARHSAGSSRTSRLPRH